MAVPRDNPEGFYIEDSQAAMEYAIMADMGIDYYAIELDENDVPRVMPRVGVEI